MHVWDQSWPCQSALLVRLPSLYLALFAIFFSKSSVKL
jgi:hypothetical protein